MLWAASHRHGRGLVAVLNGMLERLDRAFRAQRRLTADVSHELRTPLAALRSFNELLTEGQVPDEATRQEFLEQSRQQIERLENVAEADQQIVQRASHFSVCPLPASGTA